MVRAAQLGSRAAHQPATARTEPTADRAGRDEGPHMTKLLVSVRDAAEARDAVEAGADLIDVKEPQAVSLGAAAPQIVAEIIQAVAGRRPVSVALGELIDHRGLAAAASPAKSPLEYAKL